MQQYVYGGSWDWDRIYRACHAADEIGGRIRHLLGPDRKRMLFVGFPNVAAELAADRPVTFVDRSEDVIAVARARYPSLEDCVAGDVFSHLTTDRASHVVISGRMTAFWEASSSFEDFRRAICAYPRERVLIDFFDAAEAEVGRVFSFGVPPIVGTWNLLGIRKETNEAGPAIVKVQHAVSYSLDGAVSTYEVARSFFHAREVLAWCERAFPSHRAVVAPPLIPGDPSFCVDLRLA